MNEAKLEIVQLGVPNIRRARLGCGCGGMGYAGMGGWLETADKYVDKIDKGVDLLVKTANGFQKIKEVGDNIGDIINGRDSKVYARNSEGKMVEVPKEIAKSAVQQSGGNMDKIYELMMQSMASNQTLMMSLIPKKDPTPPKEDKTALYIGLGVGGVVLLMMMMMMSKK